MIARALMIGAIAVGAAACGRTTELAPAPGAQPAPAGPGEGATATSAGVRMDARVGAWSGDPATLETEITPVLVEITNTSDHPLLIRYSAFALKAPSGRTYSAMPPFDIDEQVIERVTVDAFPYSGFTVAPYLSPYYPGLIVADPFVLDRAFYSRMVSVLRRVRLPTGDMIQKALPEGVLAPQAKVAGFIYFEDIDDDDRTVTFSADLLDAQTQAQFGQITIPFVTE